MENSTLYKDLNNIPLADDDPQGKSILIEKLAIDLHEFHQLSFRRIQTILALNAILAWIQCRLVSLTTARNILSVVDYFLISLHY